MTHLVALVQRTVRVVGHVTQLSERRAMGVRSWTGSARAARAVVVTRAERDAGVEPFGASVGIRDVAQLVTLVRRAATAVGCVTKLAEHLAGHVAVSMTRTAVRLASVPYRTTVRLGTAVSRGATSARATAVVVTTANEGQGSTRSNKTKANPNRRLHAAEPSRRPG